VAPEGETEEKLAAIWSQILQIDAAVISAQKSFFELGGHSLKATVLTNKILKEFDVEVPLQDVFRMDTIAKLADYIENEKWVKGSSRQEVSLGQEFILD
jgi:acyl carrier protein